MRTTATHIAMLLCLAASAQHLPGGVSKPCVWSAANEQVNMVDTLSQNAIGLTTFQVIIPTEDAESATLISGRTLITSRRVAEPNSGQYINFADNIPANIPRIISVRHRLSESDTTTMSTANLPLSENSDSICESIVFDRLLSSRERQKVDTYLALKYGITLDQTNPSSYIGSDGRMVWNAVENAEFSHHIFGICNDTTSRLYIYENASVENIDLLKITADTIFPMSYVILGDDDQSLKYIREEGLPKRLGRTWRVSTTGETPETVSIAFDAGRIEEAYPLEAGEHYWLSINDTAYLKSADLGSLKARFDGVPLRGGMTFTIIAAKGDEQPELEDANTDDSNIYAVSTTPNPTTDGRVHLRIRLREVAGVKVGLHSFDGHLYAVQSGGGSDFYCITVTLPSEGVWVATVESGNDKRSYKLISK